MSETDLSRERFRLINVLCIVLIGFMHAGCAGPKKQPEHPCGQSSFNVKVMSFNIAGDMDDDQWQQRMHEVARIIAGEKPDVIGFQEAFLGNFKIIQAEVPGYAYYGLNEMGHDDDKDESLRLFYRTDRWAVDEDDSGIFWYTRTPDVAGSKDWEALWIRDCVYARLVDKQTGDAFYLFNSHWSYASQLSRDNSAHLMVQKIKNRKHLNPFLATGDYNARKGDSSIHYLLEAKDNPLPMETVVHNRVDWIFAQAGQFEVVEAKVVENDEASDHHAIVAEVKLYVK